MVYRVTLRSNPRILVLYLAIPIVLAAGAGSIFVFGLLFGLVLLAAGLALSWSLARLAGRQLATRAETLTDELLFRVGGDEKVLFPWSTIRLAGIAREVDARGKHRRRGTWLFIYNEQEDRLLAVPNEIENMDGLAAEIREKTDFMELVLLPGQTLKAKLREIIAPVTGGPEGSGSDG